MTPSSSSRRQAGVLLHLTSLPGEFGSGDLGSPAFALLDWLERAGQTIWQILPLSPPACGGSPYTAFSAFAGNPLLISPEKLVHAGLLQADDLTPGPVGRADRIDFERVGTWRRRLLRHAWRNFQAWSAAERQVLWDFGSQHAWWLDDFALFLALRDNLPDSDWTGWAEPFRHRDSHALWQAKQQFADDFGFHQFCQYLFFTQWREVREHARQRGVQILGDVPIFVAHNSSDVWARQDLFQLDSAGRPTVVAGVPPDYFSETGQRWGNPLYRWDRLEAEGYRWWIDRIRMTLECVDLLRIDHFRGFEAYWEIPAEAATAQTGQWIPGPGKPFFEALRSALGTLPIIAEDLGLITAGVEQLRDDLGLPGMRVLQFAFADDSRTSCHWPHTWVRNCVAYTGTHDNDTARGWYEAEPGPTETPESWAAERQRARDYLASSGAAISQDLIRAVYASVADRCVIPLQDLLDLDTTARMNIPGVAEGNWGWRVRGDHLSAELAHRLRHLVRTYARDGR